MDAINNHVIFTIGHSTRSIETFIEIIKSFAIEHLADIRSFPGSKRYPHFNKESLRHTLEQNSVEYSHFIALGGRRKPLADSTNTAWRHQAFRGYADHMQTNEFQEAVRQLEELAKSQRLAFMCSEATWWTCHRALLSDFLKVRGWNVQHIMDVGKSTPHPYTSPAKPVQGKLFY